LAGKPQPQVPPLPTGLTITPAGPDPTLSLPAVQATPGSTVTVPVNIDTAKPAGSTGLIESVLALRYDPQVFSVTAADIHLGKVPGAGTGWKLHAAVNPQTGEIGIDVYSTTAIQTSVGGSLVTITFQVLGTAPAGLSALSLVTQVSPAGHQVFRTEAVDASGPWVLHTAMTASGPEPAEPGLVTVLVPDINSQTDVPPPVAEASISGQWLVVSGEVGPSSLPDPLSTNHYPLTTSARLQTPALLLPPSGGETTPEQEALDLAFGSANSITYSGITPWLPIAANDLIWPAEQLDSAAGDSALNDFWDSLSQTSRLLRPDQLQ
jgi:hypothetical protein